ncbi:hypothetical protein W97_08694 [Coniosporium apollinis CBS 100218]|uniref:Uncharacterized protein n=1 Tax=Coniosporium apollinis (strain CBS 100218) TaxID=1168221 RepID=R7Z5Y5_CONA1|nr:uncharacterized protein W97_08694 [Coniosporium apollinis CBS 100218]EON69434.1 hypothetical protein W97_08694 [Coniosporium apollinis CBS 100218]
MGNNPPRRRIAVAVGTVVGSFETPSAHPVGPQGLTGHYGAYGTAPYHAMGTMHGLPNAFPAQAKLVGQYPMVAQRTVYPPTWSSNPYGEESSVESYSLQSSGYLPGQSTMSGLYGSHDGSNDARNYGLGSRPSMNPSGIYLDQESAAAYSSAPSAYFTTPVTRQPTVTTESTSPFGMTSLQSALTGRQLPMPTANRMQGSSMTDGLTARMLLSTQSTGLSDPNAAANYNRAAMAWNQEGVAPNERQGSIDVMAQSSAKGSSISSSIPEASGMAYIPITSSPEHSPTTGPSLGYSSTASSMPAPLLSGRSSGPSSAMLTASSGSDTSNMYTYSANSSSRHDSTGASSPTDDTLVSGQRYAPIAQPQSQQPMSVETLGSESFENRSLTGHRASVSSLRGAAY